MNSYFTYYLAWVFLSYALRTPWLLAGVVVLLVLRPFVPNPAALARLFGRARSLRAQVSVNRANITARRDLATIYLDGLRPRAAVPLLQEGLALAPNDPELLYLLGLALHRSGKHEAALEPLVRAVQIDPRVRYGLPYSVAGDALGALGRWDGALDAYEHYQTDNSSDVSGYTRLARVHAKLGDRKAARATLHEGLRTWGMLPSSMKRRQFGFYLKAHWARALVLHEPSAIALVLALTGLVAAGGYLAYRPVLGLFGDSQSGEEAPFPSLAEYARCGQQSTGAFVGKYRVKSQPGGALGGDSRLEELEILPDRVQSGTSLRQDFCLIRVLEHSDDTLVADAIWHEDIGDSGDATIVRIKLQRAGDTTAFSFWYPNEVHSLPPTRYVLRRQ